MAEQNLALELERADEDHLLHDDDVDLEAGLRSSRHHLIHDFERETVQTKSESIKRSVASAARKTRYYCAPVTDAIKYVLIKCKLLILISLYSIFGAWLFTTLEVPYDLEQKQEAYHSRLIAREVMILNLRAIYYNNREDREERWKDAIKQYEEEIKLDEPSTETDWTFWMAFLYAGTIFTTIGYGNIACKTMAGQVATILYAFVGIPIMIIILNDLGEFLLKWLQIIANFSTDGVLYLRVRYGMTKLEENSKKRRRFLAFRASLIKMGLVNSNSTISLVNTADNQALISQKKDELKPDPPVLSAICATFGWIFLSAGIFCLWEDWSYFTSIYFFFISCSTIGLGDVTPAHPQYMILAFGVVMVGLSLVTVCINVVQDKLELMYMEFLEKLLKDYNDALERGDPKAAEGMMAGFTGGSKFLLPFISKNQGARVMTQFKEHCEEQGIDPPAVLVNIDPLTGKPAFASGHKEDYNAYIEQAEEKRAEERKLEDAKLLARTPQPTEASSPKPEVVVQHMQTQTILDERTIEKHSRCIQFSPEYSDEEIQTSDAESVDEGIQSDIISTTDSWAQYDLPEPIKSTVVQADIVMCTTGVQPEVSSIYFADEGITDTELSSDSSSDEEDEEDEADISMIVTESPEVVVESGETPEGYSDHLTVEIPSLARLQKSVSEESQETVIHVTPTGSPQMMRKNEDKEKKEKKKDKKKRKKKRDVNRELRFMKNSGDQTCFEHQEIGIQVERILCDSSTQHIVNLSEAYTQEFTETRGRRIQTKLTCISKDNLLSLSARKSSSRGPKRRKRPDSRSIRSSVASTEPIESSSSNEDLKQRQQSLASIEEASSSVDASVGDEQGHVEEVNVNLTLLAMPVDEEGRIVEDYDTELDDDVFESDDDLSEEELELFAVTSSTQTDTDIANMDTQTELSTFRHPTRPRKPKKLKRIPEISIDSEEVPESHDVIDTETAVIKESTSHSTSVGPDEVLEDEEEEEDEEQILCMVETSVQTLNTSFHLAPQQGLPTIFEGSREDSIDSIPDQSALHFLVDGITQTSYHLQTSSCQTEPLLSTSSVEAIREDRSIDTQTSISTSSIDVQTTCEQVEQVQTSNDVIECSSQTTFVESKQVVQTEHEYCEQEVQTTVEYGEEEIQTEDRELEEVDVQTDDPQTSHLETQTELEVSEVDSQTEGLKTKMNFCQTDSAMWTNAEMQTDVVWRDQKRTQTDHALLMAEGTESIAVDATMTYSSVQSQSDVSMFVVDEEERSVLETEHDDVRFNVERGTYMEDKEQFEFGAQSTPELETTSIQCMPSMTTSHTQHTNYCLTDGYSQTDVSMRSQSSQDVNTTIYTSTAVSQTTTEYSSSEMQATAEQHDVQSECDIDFLPPISTSTMLWSDFDRVLEKPAGQTSEEDEPSRIDIQTQTDMTLNKLSELIANQEMAAVVGLKTAVHLALDDRKKKDETARKKSTVRDIVDALESMKGSQESLVESARNSDVEEVKASGRRHTMSESRGDEKRGQLKKKKKKMSEGDQKVDDSETEAEEKREKKRKVAPLEPEEKEKEGEEEDKKKKKLVKRKKKNTGVDCQLDKKPETHVAHVQATPSMEVVEVQASPEVVAAACGPEADDNWLEVYVTELDEERRLRMLDIGIQTGVLARVQHMYGRKEGGSNDPEGTLEMTRVNLRKTESTEQLYGGRHRRSEGSQESLARTSSVMSIAESLYDESSPGPSKPTSRTSSFKRTRRMKEMEIPDNQTVADLRSRFEQEEEKEKAPRSSSNER